MSGIIATLHQQVRPVLRRFNVCGLPIALAAVALTLSATADRALQAAGRDPSRRPNIILCMTDDQGWGDTGYNGHPVLKTPTLDAMSRRGVRFTRFYSAAPVCSPTRGSCLTGRHPFRYGIFHANVGHLPKQEINLADLLKKHGYTTGHFGKWHLGTLTKTVKDSNRGGPRGAEHYAPPWERGFDVCFSTEAKVPTYDPMVVPQGWRNRKTGAPFGTYYWTGPGRRVTDNLEGDDSRVIMDRAIPFIAAAAKAGKPFFAVIWFHTPHLPVVAGEKHRALYKDQPERAQHYFGCISAMDEQMGRLRETLGKLGVRENTMLWFCADNGPEGPRYNKMNGSAGPLRGRKRSLYEGGVRVPGLLEWPARFGKPRAIDMPCCTSDYLPTILDALGIAMPDRDRPIDGISLLDAIDGKTTERPEQICFQSSGQVALIDNRYKLYRAKKGKPYELYDLIKDPSESNDLAAAKRELVARMAQQVEAWQASCKASLKGKDYAEKRNVETPKRQNVETSKRQNVETPKRQNVKTSKQQPTATLPEGRVSHGANVSVGAVSDGDCHGRANQQIPMCRTTSRPRRTGRTGQLNHQAPTHTSPATLRTR